MKCKATQIKTKITALLLVAAMALTMFPAISPAAQAHGATGYDFQPTGADNTANSMKMLEYDEDTKTYITRRDVEFVSSDKGYYWNEIKSDIDGTDEKGIIFTFTMSAGMNNFQKDGFLLNNMPQIKIYDINDVNETNPVAQYSEGSGDLKFLGSHLTDEINNHGSQKTNAIDIGVDQGVLTSGTYVLVFGKDLCGNNTEKILGQPIKFQFKVKAAPSLQVMIDTAQDFLDAAKIDDTGEANTYPTTAAKTLEEAIAAAKDEQSRIATLPEADKKAAEDSASDALYKALEAFKRTRCVLVDKVIVTNPKQGQEVWVGDKGIASASVQVDPNEDQYQKVTWSCSDNLTIDEKSGAWQANRSGTGTIMATSTKDPNKSGTCTFNVKTEPGVVTVNLNNKNVRLQQMIEAEVNANVDYQTIADVKSVKIFTSNGGMMTSEDWEYVRGKLTALTSLNLKNVEVEDSQLPTSALAGTKLTKVVLPDTLEKIGPRAFYNCASLSSIELPAALTGIESGAFAGCISLPKELTVWAVCPPNYATTGTFGSAFNGTSEDQATSVERIRVPYSCAADYRAASGWRAFSTITEMNREILKVNFVSSGSLQQAAQNALNDRGLTEAQVSDLVITSSKGVQMSRSEDVNGYLQSHFLNTTTLDFSGTEFEDNKCNANTFKDRISLKHITLPDSTTTIGGTCFSGCKNLREMVLPESLGNIGSGAFNDCNKMGSEIIVPVVEPPTYSGDIFPTCITTIVVPPQSVEKYKTATGWSQYRNNIVSQISLALSASQVSLQAPMTYALTAIPTKKGGDPRDVSVRWSSSNASVASVSPAIGQQTTITANKPGTATITAKDASGYVTAACTVTVTGLAAPTIKAAAAGYNRANVTWTAVSGAAGYELFRATKQNGAYTKVRTLTASTRSYIDTGLSTGTAYYYKVRAYKTSGSTRYAGSYSNIASAKPALAKVKSVKAKNVKAKKKAKTGSAKVTWKTVSGASGYTVYRSLKKNKGYKAVKTVKGSKKKSWTVSKLKKGKQYYFKVRAYRTIKGKKVYGAYSAAVSCKVKK